MPSKTVKDQYANRAMATITMSAANTLTFQQIRFSTGLFEGIALKLNRVEFHPIGATVDELVAAADSLTMSLTTRDDLTSLDPTNLSVLYQTSLTCIAANVEYITTPIVADFSTLPQEGLLIPANPLYVCMNTSGFAAAGVARVVLYYQFVKLSPQENLELLQTIIPGTV